MFPIQHLFQQTFPFPVPNTAVLSMPMVSVKRAQSVIGAVVSFVLEASVSIHIFLWHVYEPTPLGCVCEKIQV